MSGIPVYLNRAELADELQLPKSTVFLASVKHRVLPDARLVSGAPLFLASRLNEIRAVLTAQPPQPAAQ